MGVGGPGHDEYRRRDRRGSNHGIPQPELGSQACTALFLDLLQIPVRPNVYQRDEEASAEKTDADADKCESSQALGETICLSEDKSITVEKSEENDVNDGQVERNKHDDGLSSCKQQRSI